MIRQRLVAGIVAATALVSLTACGSSTKSSSTTKPTATAPAADATSTNPATGVSTPDVSAPDTSVPDVSISGNSFPDVSSPEATGRCIELEKDVPDLSGGTNIKTSDVNKAFASLSASVPADLKDDVAALKSALQPFYAAVDAAGGDATKAMQDPEVLKKVEAAVTDPKFTAASAALQDWFTKGCPS